MRAAGVTGRRFGAHAVLGPVDPQIGEMPAASIVRMVEIKGPANVSDQGTDTSSGAGVRLGWTGKVTPR